MQHLEVNSAIRPLKWSLGVKWLIQFSGSCIHVCVCVCIYIYIYIYIYIPVFLLLMFDYGALAAETCYMFVNIN